MSDHWTTLRLHNEAQRHRAATLTLREHPLALRPDERARLEAAGLITARGQVIRFAPAFSDDKRLQLAAEFYLGLDSTPPGTARRIAEQRNLNFHRLLQAITDLRLQNSRHGGRSA